jgi:probable H4MPT-linked C1 transfer pathway protein
MAADDVLALDIGGANVKAADGRGWAVSEAFPLWRLRPELPALIARIGALRRPGRIVATMTGEIADCYGSRSEGVADIVAAVDGAAAGQGCPAQVYLVDGTLVPPAEACRRWREAAASNWHALARLAGTVVADRPAFLLDVGSTTTDVVPLAGGVVAATGRDDLSRLAAWELVYTGVERTPLAALVRRLPWRGRLHPVAAELFAQTLDVWLLLGGLPEEHATKHTADGGPATRAGARRRLARMLLADADEVTEAEAIVLAEWCAARQARMVAVALARVAATRGWRPEVVVLSGHGGCLARRALALLGWPVGIVSLEETLGREVSRAAPAHALALIARREVP